MGDQKLLRQTSNGRSPTFKNISFVNGTTAHVPYVGGDGRPSTGWHAEFGDIDNDGLDDLFIAKGNVDQMPSAAMTDPKNLLMQSSAGGFTERGDAAGLATTHQTRGAAVIDLNADGLLDIVDNNRCAPLEHYQNKTSTSGHWVAIQVSQPAPNTAAVGAWIEITDGVRTWFREVTVGGGHAGGKLGYHHFGLGASTDISVRVIWPDRSVSPWQNVPKNQQTHLFCGRSLVSVR